MFRLPKKKSPNHEPKKLKGSTRPTLGKKDKLVCREISARRMDSHQKNGCEENFEHTSGEKRKKKNDGVLKETRGGPTQESTRPCVFKLVQESQEPNAVDYKGDEYSLILKRGNKAVRERPQGDFKKKGYPPGNWKNWKGGGESRTSCERRKREEEK